MDSSYQTVTIDIPADAAVARSEHEWAGGVPLPPGRDRGATAQADAGPGGGFEAQIADRPMVLKLDQLFSSRGLTLPSDYAVYGMQYDLWLVPHRVSVVRRSGLSEVTAIGVRVAYSVDGACSVVSLLPEHQFVERGSLMFRCSSDAQASLRTSVAIDGAEPVAGGQLRVGVDASVRTRLGFELSVATPMIAAVGKGSRHAEWSFELSKEPLHGRDIETWSVLLVPAGLREMNYEIVMNLTRRLAFFPTRWESAPLAVNCRLAG